MMLPGLLNELRALPAYRALTGDLPGRGVERHLLPLPGSSGAALVAALAGDEPQRVIVVVAGSPARAEAWHADLGVLLGPAAQFYPQREGLGEEEPHYEIAGERVETLDALLAGRARVLVTTVRASAERTRVPRALVRSRLRLATGATTRPADAVARVEAMGYARVPTVTDVAQVAVRGGIVDLYGFGMATPVRVEWWGDEILSVRGFDLDTQRSEREIGDVTAPPVTVAAGLAGAADQEAQSLLELLPADSLLVTDDAAEPDDVRARYDYADAGEPSLATAHDTFLARRVVPAT